MEQEEENEDNIIYFLNNDEEKKGKMELIKKNEDNKDVITYEDIKFSFENFLKKLIQGETINGDNEIELFDINDLNNITYQYIAYMYGEGWILFKENGNIFLDEELSLNNLKIMIKATILPRETIKIVNKIEKIQKEIDNIKEKINDIENNDVNYSRFNSIILVANPLKYEEEELRTVNDFNIIPATIYNLFNEEDYLKYSEFGILTRESFINAISDKQKEFFILHLICKSTYIIDEKNKSKNKNSSDYVNLVFEQKDYNCDFINKDEVDKIFSEEIKENIKKIVLIISTPLAEDVYNIFNKYGFKNILIQHNFVADFNLRFYQNLILNRFQNFKSIYNDALNTTLDENENDFCCCFHKHKTNCNFFLNLNKELYNNNNINNNNNLITNNNINLKANNNNKPVNDLDDLKSTIPHFCHLKPDCQNTPKCIPIFNDFYVHTKICLKHFILGSSFVDKEHRKIKYIKDVIPNGYSFCCCFLDKGEREYNDIAHNLNNIFKTNFNNENIKNYKATIILKNNYIPKYEKMPIFAGNNKDIINVLNALNSEDYIYIYGDTINNLKIFINNIIEYYKERYYFHNLDKKENRKIEHIILDGENSENFEDLILYKSFCYIYIHDIKFIEFIEKEFKKRHSILNYKIILFSEHELKKDDINTKYFIIKINPEPSEPKNKKEYIPNYYIKFQDKHQVRNVFYKEKIF